MVFTGHNNYTVGVQIHQCNTGLTVMFSTGPDTPLAFQFTSAVR